MRIGIILSLPLPPREGIGTYAWSLAFFLRDRGHQIHLVTHGGGPAVAQEAAAQEVEGMTIHRLGFVPLYPFHMHFHNLFVSNWIASFRDSLDLLHLLSPLVLPPPKNLPMLVTMHGLFISEIPVWKWLGRGIERRLFRRANRLIAVSQAVARQLEIFGVRPEKVPIIGTGVLADFFVSPPPRIFLPEKPVFLTVGPLVPGRGFEDFIRACQKVQSVHPNVRFLIVGGGSLEARFRNEINRYYLDGVVRPAGAVTDRLTLSIFYQNAYAFAQPAPLEKLLTSLLEAMSCGRAVIAVDTPDVRGGHCRRSNWFFGATSLSR